MQTALRYTAEGSNLRNDMQITLNSYYGEGESDPTAVVDQYCRVRGVQNLRVVDLSITPDVVRANTNATAIMIAKRVVG